MATIKSFTDLLQSKKLAEFLPLESADHFHIIGHLHTDGPRYEVIRPKNEVSEPEKYWPCWSLAALLGVIPYPTLGKHANETWSCASWVEKVNPYFVEGCDSSINACYKMIIKLHEQNLL